MSFQLIAGKNLDSYINKSPYIILDLRNHEEYAAGHIRGAQNLPYAYYDKFIEKLPREKTYILYCNYGSISMLAGKRMDEAGYDVLSISGGISSYRGSLFV
ncbi:MAG: rhodanese-like domain-containing protein [Coprococcus sp.]